MWGVQRGWLGAGREQGTPPTHPAGQYHENVCLSVMETAGVGRWGHTGTLTTERAALVSLEGRSLAQGRVLVLWARLAGRRA